MAGHAHWPGTTGAAGMQLGCAIDRNPIEQKWRGRPHAWGDRRPGWRHRCGRAIHLPEALGGRKDAIDIYDHIRFEVDERGKSSVLFAIWYLIDVASGIKLQNKDHLACLIYIVNKPVFAKSYPESGLMAFALFNIKIGR